MSSGDQIFGLWKLLTSSHFHQCSKTNSWNKGQTMSKMLSPVCAYQWDRLALLLVTRYSELIRNVTVTKSLDVVWTRQHDRAWRSLVLDLQLQQGSNVCQHLKLLRLPLIDLRVHLISRCHHLLQPGNKELALLLRVGYQTLRLHMEPTNNSYN